jgi:hypothetical protein
VCLNALTDFRSEVLTPKQGENFMYANSTRGTDRTQSSDLYLWGLLKPEYTEQQIKMKKHLTNAFFNSCQTIIDRPGA